MANGEWRMANGSQPLIRYSPFAIRLPIRRIQRDVAGELALPAGAVVEELVLVVEELLPRLDRELVVRPLHDGVDRAGLLAEAAIDALHHVDVVTGCAASAVVAARPRLDGDGLGRADRLAELAGDAALLPVGVAPQRVLASEPRAAIIALEGIVDGRLRREEIFHREPEGRDELPQEDRSCCLVELHRPPPFLSSDRPAHEVADNRKRANRRHEPQAPEPRDPALVIRLLGRGRRAVRRPQPPLDHGADHLVVDPAEDQPEKRADQPGRRHLVSSPAPSWSASAPAPPRRRLRSRSAKTPSSRAA